MTRLIQRMREELVRRNFAESTMRTYLPVGGLAPDRNRWLQPRYRRSILLGVLKKVFRGSFSMG